MRRARFGFAVCASLFLATHACTQAAHFEVDAERISMEAAAALLREWRTGDRHRPGGPLPAPTPSAATDSMVYDNNIPSGNFITPGIGFEMADDVQMVGGGFMSRFEIAYVEQLPQLVDLLCIFRENTTANTPGQIIAGPYLIRNRIQGVHAVRVTLGVPPPLRTRLWFGLAFSTPSAGPILCGPPVVGTSEDVLYDVDRARTVVLRTAPSSFYLRIWVLEPVAVQEITWSSVKALYGVD